MKPSTKENIQKGLRFIEEIKNNPRSIPFLQPDDMERLGLFDFKFITRRSTKFSFIEQKIKQAKYIDFEQLISDLKLIFQTIGYYVPLNDPLQTDIKYFLSEIDKWKINIQDPQVVEQQPSTIRQGSKPKQAEQSTRQSFNKNQKHYQSQREKKIKNYASLQQEKDKIMQVTKAYRLPVRSSLAQKLEMIYFLKAHEANEPFIHMIGEMYGIGKETEDQYVIKLDNSTCCSWLQVLQNNQNSQ